MPLIQLDTENADLNLTSTVTVLTDTPGAALPMQCQGLIHLGDGLKNLDGSGGNFELTVTVGGQTIQPNPKAIAFGTEPRASIWTDIFPVPTGEEVVLRIKSPNGADTDVDVTAYLFDTIGGVWDEALTGSTHNISNSSGKKLRDVASDIVLTGTSPNTGGTANTAIRIELANDASSVDGAYDPAIVVISLGTGVGQARQIFEYDGDNRYAYINRSWKAIPDETSEYVIVGHSGDTHVNEGLAGGGGNSKMILNTLADGNDGTYIGQTIFLAAGTGEDQSRRVIGYDGATREATVSRPWVTNPVNGETVYAMLPSADVNGMATEAKQDIAQTDLDTLTDSSGEPGQGAPPESATLIQKMSYLYKAFRNKVTVSGVEVDIYDDAGTTVDHKASISDDNTTFTRDEFGSGP